MAVSGASGWIPSNQAKLKGGELVFLAITQNKPRWILPSIEKAARLLIAGEAVTVDMRWEAMSKLRELIGGSGGTDTKRT